MAAMSIAEKFWSRVDRKGSDDCWPWIGGITGKGYGGFYLGSIREGNLKYRGAHVIALELTTGQTRPEGDVVMHSCNNRKCCNPAHLSFGPQSANVQQAFDQGRKISTKHRAKLSELSVQRIRIVGYALSVMRMSKLLNVSSSAVHQARIFQTWPYLTSNKQALQVAA